jgi:hypothetical protein
MKRNLLLTLTIILLGTISCKKDNNEFPSYLKGIVKFKPYEMSSGPQPLLYADNEIRFVVDLQLSGSTKKLDIEVDYHLLDGTEKIGEGKVRVNILLDAGLGIYWGSDENYIPINAAALKGKTLTVYLDPDNKYTGNNYTNESQVNLYKKASITIP